MSQITRWQDHPLVAGLPSGQLAALAPLVREVRFAPGDTILHEGAPADTVYLLAAGTVALTVHMPGRGTTQLETLAGGTLLGLSWLQPNGQWHLEAQVREPVTGWALPAGELLALMERQPKLGYRLCRRLLQLVVGRLERARLQSLDVYGEVR